MGANLKEVRERISSVKSTQQITKAMKMVSAAKLRRAQDAITAMRPYADKLDEMLKNILSNLDGDVVVEFGKEREVNRALLVIVTSNRGLCGAFNTSVLKKAVEVMDGKFAELRQAGKLDVLCIGKKGYDYISRRFDQDNVIADHVHLFSDLSFDNVATVSNDIMDKFKAGTYDAVEAVYGRFKNAAVQYPTAVQFLPVPKMEGQGGDDRKVEYIFEPDKLELLNYLVPSILQTQFQKFLLDTHASEHGARMTAMDKATENAQDLLKDLKISYNKARQEAITKELSEIVGGAAAL